MTPTPKQPDATVPQKRQHPVIAIDGPAGAGKSTLAAEVKIFLDAAPEVRGNRRYRQAIPSPIALSEPNASEIAHRQVPDPLTAEQRRLAEEAIIRELKERDYRDRHRAESPLQPAP